MPIFNLEILRSFCDLQARLLTSFFSVHPTAVGQKWLLGSPKRSELVQSGEVWDVLKHGAGLMFRRRDVRPFYVVDVHTSVDLPYRVDAWRLQQYMESSGRPIKFEVLQARLKEWVDEGILLVHADGGFELKSN